MSKTNKSSLKSSESVPPPICAMCLENLPGQNDYCKTSCGHEFHLSCMLTYTARKGALRYCVEATSVMCPLCRKELHNIPRDIDRELLHMVTWKNWSARKLLLEEGAKYSASIREGDYPNDGHKNLGMMALHFAVRDAAPTEIIKEIYYAHPIALISLEGCGLTPFDLFPYEYELEKFGWTVERATEVKEFLEAQLPADVRE